MTRPSLHRRICSGMSRLRRLGVALSSQYRRQKKVSTKVRLRPSLIWCLAIHKVVDAAVNCVNKAVLIPFLGSSRTHSRIAACALHDVKVISLGDSLVLVPGTNSGTHPGGLGQLVEVVSLEDGWRSQGRLSGGWGKTQNLSQIGNGVSLLSHTLANHTFSIVHDHAEHHHPHFHTRSSETPPCLVQRMHKSECAAHVV